MFTKQTITRKSIDELSKVCPGVTLPSVAQSTLYGGGDGTRNNPFTWWEYQAYLRDGQNTGCVYYYDVTGNLIGGLGEVVVTGEQSEEERRRKEEEERLRREEEERRRLEEARLRMDMLWLNLYNGTTGNIDYNSPSGTVDPNNQNPGSGGSAPGSNNPQPKFTPVETMKKENFVGYDISGDCMIGAKAIMAKYKLTPAPAAQRKEFVALTGVASADIVAAAMNVVDACLSKGQPRLAGVRTSSDDNPNGAQHANHFVVITGRGEASGRMYFTYMETGVSDPSAGCNVFTNRFYYNEATKMWVDDYSGYNDSRSSYLTEFRPNL